MTAACAYWVSLYFRTHYRIYGLSSPLLSLFIFVPIFSIGCNVVTGLLPGRDKQAPLQLLQICLPTAQVRLPELLCFFVAQLCQQLNHLATERPLPFSRSEEARESGRTAVTLEIPGAGLEDGFPV